MEKRRRKKSETINKHRRVVLLVARFVLIRDFSPLTNPCRGVTTFHFASEHLRAREYMPAPGPKDGHASKASRDLQLTRGTSAKSNGFKYGGGTLDGANSASVRTGISSSSRPTVEEEVADEVFGAEAEARRRRSRSRREREKRFPQRNGPNEEEKQDDDDEEEENKNTNKKRRVDQN